MDKKSSKTNEIFRVGGSGSDDFTAILNKYVEPEYSRPLNPLENAVAKFLSLTSIMNGSEVRNGYNLINLYGGGYEIASFVHKKFTKIDDITYLLWEGVQTDNDLWGFKMPKRVIKYYYQNDILLIRTIEISYENEIPTIINEMLFPISPIYRNLDIVELEGIKPKSFNSRFICSLIFLIKINGDIELLSRVNYSDKGENPIQFYNENSEKIGMKFNKNFIKSIFNSKKSPLS